MRVQDLNRHEAIDGLLPRFKDFPHPSLTDDTNDFISAIIDCLTNESFAF